MNTYQLVFALSLALCLPIQAEHSDNKNNQRATQTTDAEPARRKVFYFECTASASTEGAGKIDLGSFVIDITDFAFWFSSEGFRITESAKALDSYLTVTGQFKNMKSQIGTLQLELSQQRFSLPGDSPVTEVGLSSKSAEVAIDKPFALHLRGKGALKEATVSCEPLSESAGANRKAYVSAVERLREAHFVIDNSKTLHRAQTPEQIASKVNENLGIAREFLREISDAHHRTQVEKFIANIQKAVDSDPTLRTLVEQANAERRNR